MFKERRRPGRLRVRTGILTLTVFLSMNAHVFPADPGQAPLPLAVRWWGQACVSIDTFWGFMIVIDPFTGTKLGYPELDIEADLVLVTHNHFDHTGIDAVKGKPVVLRGLTEAGEWNEIDHILDRPPNAEKAKVSKRESADKPSPHAVRVKGIPVYHDRSQGEERGKNMAFLIEVDGVRMLHLGDLGHALNKTHLEQLGEIDLLMIPVGGTYTIDADGACDVIRQVGPPLRILPIHYQTGVNDLPLATLDGFLTAAEQAKWGRLNIKGNAFAITRLPKETSTGHGRPHVIVCDFKPVVVPEKIQSALEAMRADRQNFIEQLGGVSDRQLDHKPSDGTHTLRWNFEHTTGRELGFFSQVYNSLDGHIPHIDWNPAQMPPDHKPLHPDWSTAEMVRHVQRVGAFTERFSYLLDDVPLDEKIEGTRFSVKSLTKLLIGHYRNHAGKAVKKFELPDWPED